MLELNKIKPKETEDATIPKEWSAFELGKVAELIKDAYLPNKSEVLPYIGLEHIDQQTLSLNSVGESSDVTSNKFRFKSGDILFGKLRPYFRKVYRPKFSGICSTDIWVVRAKKGFDQGWLFWLIASEDFVKSASGGSAGTRMPRADWKHLKDTIWPVPPLTEQKQIAEILSSLDDKIELNRKMNENLEKIASALFKHWFVDFEFPDKNGKPYKFSGGKMIESELEEIPEGWRVGKVSDLIRVESGFPFNSSMFDESGQYKLVTIKNVQDGHFVSECTDSLSGIPTKMPDHCLLKNSDILLSLTGNVGRICLVNGEKYLLNQRVANLIPINENDRAFTYFLFRQNDFKNILTGISRGTAQQNLSPIETKSIEITLPPYEVLNGFAQVTNTIFRMIVDNNIHIINLSILRDSLSPRLMGGKIRVNQYV